MSIATGHPAAERSLRVEHRPDGVALLWMDVPNESVNTLKKTFSAEFHMVLDELRQDNTLRAVVFASGKVDSFLAGADVEMLNQAHSAAEASELSKTAQQAMNVLADFRVPVVAAIHGSCLGGGLELALACHGRVCSDHPKTKLGLPEVQLGLLPGAGGTQRLPRLVGIQAALDLMLTGKQIPARKAKRIGLVDEVVPAAIVVEAAIAYALKLAHQNNGTGHKARTTPGSAFKEALLAKNPLGRAFVFDQAIKQVTKQTRGHYPAPFRILDVVRTGLAQGMQSGLAAECTAFGELALTPVAKELMYLFFAQTALKKDPGTTAKVAPVDVNKVGMIGAGLMGSGIAYVTAAQAKIAVRLKDRDTAGVGKGVAHVASLVKQGVKRKRIDRIEAAQIMARLSPSTDYSGFKTAEVVIEAVFEDLGLKHQIVKDVEAAGKKDVIVATNTSSIPITHIATASAHPETVIGMHYFSPVHKMPLLEIIVTEKTAPWVTATCVALGKRQGKTVIVVNDGVGFYTSRILAPYMNEAAFLLTEGVPIEDIDKALTDFGFPVGPITLLDEVGIDVAEKVGKIMHEAFGERLRPPGAISQLATDQRLGRKNKRGFYVYSDDNKKGEKAVDQTIYPVLGLTPDKRLPLPVIAERCVLQMINEAALCLQEGILRSPRDGDIGAVFGLGFPPFLGGPFRYIESLGAAEIKRRLEHSVAEHGPRFAPAAMLSAPGRSVRP